MKIHYLILFLFSVSLSAQTTLLGTTDPDLSGYFGDNSENWAGLAEYQIFLDTQTGVLDKPIILIDGFDPGDGRSLTGLYDLLSYDGMSGTENLADFVRAEGFDVVILNLPAYFRLADDSLLHIDDATDVNMDMVINEADYPGSTLIDGGADFIERNAMLLVDLISIINTDKIGDEENVIIGPSMGGLISRFALNYMEQQTLDHDTRLWLSFDAPHHGANVPIGLQHQLNFLAFGLGDGLNVTDIQPLIDGFLKSPAARQLLTDHFEAHLQGGSDVEFDGALLEPAAHPWRGIFASNIEGLTGTGFPENTRNVSIINGSRLGNSYFAEGDSGPLVTPGYEVIDLTINNVAPFTNFFSNVNFTPATTDGTQAVSQVLVTFFGAPIVSSTANAAAFSFSDGIDAASGGLFDLSGLTGDIPVDPGSLAEDFLNSLAIDKFNFIPSVSGMGLILENNTNIDWWFATNAIGDGTPPTGDVTNQTPFINWYMPDANEPHVQLTEANVAFALTEIIPETLSVNQFENNTILLERNPISTELIILAENNISNAHVQLFDLTGKSVFTSKMDLNNRNSIPINLQSGIYLLNVVNDEGLTFKAKVAVK